MSYDDPNTRIHLPLTPVVFEILIALADQPRHGYGVMQEVEARSGTRLRAGTLYRAIDRLLTEGHIEEVTATTQPANRDGRRRTYRLTKLGRRVAVSEAQRLAAALDAARAKKLLQPEQA
jgi:DNA-binding PadR family transcriptional regulator